MNDTQKECVTDVPPLPTFAELMAEIKSLKQVRSDDFLTVEEAAEALGIKPTAIRNYLHANLLTTFKFKTLTLISEEEVRRWKTRQRKNGHGER